MNQVTLVARISRDPEVRYTQAGLCWASFTVAVDNPGKDKGASFPSCKAFGETAQKVEKYGLKGRLVALSGHLQTGSYTNKKGDKVYTTDVIIDRIEFLDKKQETQPDEIDTANAQPNPVEGFSQLGISDDIPF